MAACGQSSRSEQYDAPRLPDHNMGESLQVMGPEFEQYLPVMMLPLFRAADVKAVMSVYGL